MRAGLVAKKIGSGQKIQCLLMIRWQDSCFPFTSDYITSLLSCNHDQTFRFPLVLWLHPT